MGNKLYKITDKTAANLMAGLRAGKTLRAFSIKAERLELYLKNHPDYAAEARPLLEANVLAARRRKGDYNRSKTHCKFGHPFALHQRLNFDKGSVIRKCNMCHFLRYKRGGAVKPEVLAKVKAALRRGVTISSLTASGKSTRLLAHHALKRARREHPDIEALAAKIIEGSRARALRTRWTHVRNEARREQNNDYYAIRAMLPASIPDRDEIVSAIFEDILSGALKREDVKSRIRTYVSAHNQMFATRYRKFGDSLLISLDEAMFDDGGGTRGDYVSRGLWD